MITSSTTVNHSQRSEELRHQQRQEEIATAKKQVKDAFQATMFIGGMTTIIWLASLKIGGFLLIIDVVIIFGLGYGIYRYNQKCAELMLGYYIVSKLIQISSGSFPILAIFITSLMIKYLWYGVVGTKEYNRLMAEDKIYRTTVDFRAESTDRDRDDFANSTRGDRMERPDLPRERSDIKESKISRSEPLNPSSDLIALCGGERSQAQWLLSQIKKKNPDRSVEWCNEQAIEQLKDRNQ